MKKWSFAVMSLVFSSMGYSGAMGPIIAPAPPVLEANWLSGFFLGLGGSYNLINYNQNFNGELSSTVGGALNTTLRANGRLDITSNHSTFAPNIQGGYISNFENNFWGLKYVYQYLNGTSNFKFISAPIHGTYTSTIGDGVITGRVTANFLQTQVNQEMMLLGFLGRSFTNGGIYIGIGPALLETRTHISGISANERTSSIVYDFLITGPSNSSSNKKWLLAGAAQIGYSYFLSPTWFVDVNYTYARSANNSSEFSTAFRTTANGNQGLLVNQGTLSWSTHKQISVQGFNVTINKVFPMY